MFQEGPTPGERKQPDYALQTGSELTLILGVPKKHCSLPVKVGAYGDQV